MKKTTVVSALFVVAAAYDGLLGLAFLFAGATVFRWANIAPPNHLGYVQFPAALLVVFAIMFLAIARNPHQNRGLIPYGILLKVSYCGVVGYNWLAGGIPFLWKPFAIFDLAFVALFLWAYRSVGRPRSS